MTRTYVVIGPTGSGKTNFINAIEAGTPKSGPLDSGTRSINSYMVECDGRRLVILDTPGLDSKHLADEKIFMLAAQRLHANHPSNIDLGIVYFHRITDNRIYGSPRKHIEMLRGQCDGVAVRRIYFVTTMWDDVVNTAEAEMRETFLKQEVQKENFPDIFKRFDNRRPSKSASQIMSELVRDYPTTTTASNRDTLDNMFFLVMGPTGSGKTNFIDALDGRLRAGGSAALNTGTHDVIPHIVKHCGQDRIFVDTPGLNGIHIPDAEIYRRVRKLLEASNQSSIELGIIYLHRITENRIKGSPHDHIEALRIQCGVAVCQACLVTTMWEDVDDKVEAEKRERLLREEFQNKNVRPLFKRFDNQPSSAWNIASELMGGEARQLQLELEGRERRSTEPGAGIASYDRAQRLLSRRREKIQQRIAQADTDTDWDLIQDLQVELYALDTQIQRSFRERQEWNISLIRRVLQWLSRRVSTT